MTNNIEESIRKIGAELDPDIMKWMLSTPEGGEYKNWELLHHPVDNMLAWQAMRDRKLRRCSDNHPEECVEDVFHKV